MITGADEFFASHPAAKGAAQERVGHERSERFEALMFERERDDGAFIAMVPGDGIRRSGEDVGTFGNFNIGGCGLHGPARGQFVAFKNMLFGAPVFDGGSYGARNRAGAGNMDNRGVGIHEYVQEGIVGSDFDLAIAQFQYLTEGGAFGQWTGREMHPNAAELQEAVALAPSVGAGNVKQ